MGRKKLNSSRTIRIGDKYIDLVSVTGDAIDAGAYHLIKQVRSSYKMNWGGLEEDDKLVWNDAVDNAADTTHFITKIYDKRNGLTKIVSLTQRKISLHAAQLPGDIHWWEVVKNGTSLPYEKVITENTAHPEVSIFTRLAAYTPYKIKKADQSSELQTFVENDTLLGVAEMLKSALVDNETTIWTIGPILRDKVFKLTYERHTASLELPDSMHALGLADSHTLRLKKNAETIYLRTTYPGYWNDLHSLRNFIVKLFQEKIVRFDELPGIFFDGLNAESNSAAVSQVLQRLHYYDVQHLSPLLQGKITLQSGFSMDQLHDRLFSDVKHGPISVLASGLTCVRNADTILDLAALKFTRK